MYLIVHILNSLVIKKMEMDWSEMYSLIVGFDMEDWKWSYCNYCTFIGWKYQAVMASEKTNKYDEADVETLSHLVSKVDLLRYLCCIQNGSSCRGNYL